MAGDAHAHPSSKQYVQIAILLAVITAIEVALFYIEEAVGLRGFEAPLLIVLSFMKFLIVIGWYMHLRFEKSLLSRFFTAGFVLALLLYAVVLAAFGVLALGS
jgi:cytochrome c oxidase subunit 4